MLADVPVVRADVPVSSVARNFSIDSQIVRIDLALLRKSRGKHSSGTLLLHL